MGLWLFRAGKIGEYEDRFLKDKRIYLTWSNLNINLNDYKNKEKLLEELLSIYDSEKKNTVRNWASQIYPIAHTIKKGDWIVLPSKKSSTIHFGEVVGDYKYNKFAENRFKHYREVNWFATDIPRDNFDQDILYSFGAFLTVCKITRNDAEKRIHEMAENNWKVHGETAKAFMDPSDVSLETITDIEMASRDAISKYIIRKYQGYKMEELICGILKAKGFTVFHSKQGSDGGKDLLAAGGEMGFGTPQICVQVKTQDTPVDRTILDQLGGVMTKVGAEYGLLVSWSGFKNSVEQERGNQFFRIRLWDSNDVIDELINNYDKLGEDIKSDIPLKKIWMISDDSGIEID